MLAYLTGDEQRVDAAGLMPRRPNQEFVSALTTFSSILLTTSKEITGGQPEAESISYLQDLRGTWMGKLKELKRERVKHQATQKYRCLYNLKDTEKMYHLHSHCTHPECPLQFSPGPCRTHSEEKDRSLTKHDWMHFNPI